MASTWTQSHCEGWLARFYGEKSGEDNGDYSDEDTKVLSKESVHWQLVGVIENLLLCNASPKETAAKTASLIVSSENPEIAWSNHLGIYLSAAETFTDEKELKVLVDYIVELASLPDAVNEGPKTKTWTSEQGETVNQEVCVKPGEEIVLSGGRLWRDLPEFSMNVTERFQGE
jgi:hypothetical protein